MPDSDQIVPKMFFFFSFDGGVPQGTSSKAYAQCFLPKIGFTLDINANQVPSYRHFFVLPPFPNACRWSSGLLGMLPSQRLPQVRCICSPSPFQFLPPFPPSPETEWWGRLIFGILNSGSTCAPQWRSLRRTGGCNI